MNVNDVYKGSDYLKAEQIPMGQQVRLTIGSVALVELEPSKHRIVIGFLGKDAKMILNVTNARTIGEMFGEETDNWPGKTILITSQMVDFGGRAVAGLRIIHSGAANHAGIQPAPPSIATTLQGLEQPSAGDQLQSLANDIAKTSVDIDKLPPVDPDDIPF